MMTWMTIAIIAACVPFGLWLFCYLLGARYIPHNKIGIVEKLWAARGSLSDGQIIALNKEAGFQCEMLRFCPDGEGGPFVGSGATGPDRATGPTDRRNRLPRRRSGHAVGGSASGVVVSNARRYTRRIRRADRASVAGDNPCLSPSPVRAPQHQDEDGCAIHEPLSR